VSAVFATNHEVHGLDGIQKYFDSVKEMLGKGSSYTVKLEPDRTEVFGDIAIGHGKSAEVARWGDGREYRFETRWTVVLRKEADGWKALRLQVTMDPFDNPAIAARLKARTWVMAALSVLAAGVAFAIGRAPKRQGQRINV
jgi:ketosteroid isomerase-like protein